ncbi:hypothetical protein GCM10010402_08370 [Actinomadura luteofluorescens]|uniref:hypothetical protein n=1 Tax=Actinomadura luteofluorescens TaxID=46163 RepID=UPI002164B01A|nr:hypothetical protein [Actinomadura glauciflava]MCR3738390.1 hypothetical protein [Actinomadura glauciflava]
MTADTSKWQQIPRQHAWRRFSTITGQPPGPFSFGTRLQVLATAPNKRHYDLRKRN